MDEQTWLASADPLVLLEYLRERGLDIVEKSPSDRQLRLFACGCIRKIWHLLTDEKSRRAVIEAEAQADGEEISFRFMARCGDVSQQWTMLARNEELTPSQRAQWNAADAVSILADDISPGLSPQTARHLLRSLRRAELWETGQEPPTWNNSDLKPPVWSATLIRDIFPNPYRRVLWQQGERSKRDPVGMALGSWLRWRDGLIPQLASAIYCNHDFGSLGILADALEEAGCTNEDILMHCRGRERCPWADKDPSIDHGGKDWKEMACRCHGTGWLKTDAPHARGCWVLDLLLEKI